MRPRLLTEYVCDDCGWVGTETHRLELGPFKDGTEPTEEDNAVFRDEDGQMPRTCPICGCFVSTEE